jgi:hypothetical protein
LPSCFFYPLERGGRGIRDGFPWITSPELAARAMTILGVGVSEGSPGLVISAMLLCQMPTFTVDEEGDYDVVSSVDEEIARNALREATQFVAEAKRFLKPLLSALGSLPALFPKLFFFSRSGEALLARLFALALSRRELGIFLR